MVAFPQGSISSRAGWKWDLHGDVAFLDAAVDHLRETFGATAVPLCVSGMSGGARMASRFSSSAATRCASSARWRGCACPRSNGSTIQCASSPSTGRGTGSTPTAAGPRHGGARACSTRRPPGPGPTATPPDPERTEFTPSVTRLSYGPRGDPGAVTLWVCDGAGHTWPGTRLTLGRRLFLGKVSYDVDATAEIWRALGGA